MKLNSHDLLRPVSTRQARGHGIIFILPYAIVCLKTDVFLSMRIVLQIVVNHAYDTVGTFTTQLSFIN